MSPLRLHAQALSPVSNLTDKAYRPYELNGHATGVNWVQHLELDTAKTLANNLGGEPLRVLVLYGSLRERSFSKLLALEFSRCVNEPDIDKSLHTGSEAKENYCVPIDCCSCC